MSTSKLPSAHSGHRTRFLVGISLSFIVGGCGKGGSSSAEEQPAAQPAAQETPEVKTTVDPAAETATPNPSKEAAVAPAATAEIDKTNSCILCHSDEKYLVENKKLYDYYRDYAVSVHFEAGISCDDCHGGNPKASKQKEAHGNMSLGGGSKNSALSYRKVAETCATCHEEIYKGYRESTHFEKLSKAKSLTKGPNCVTCHGSMNATILSAPTVAKVCAQCHNEKTKNAPDTPERAVRSLRWFRNIDMYYRFIASRGQPEENKALFAQVDPVRSTLAEEWHNFDLDNFEKNSKALLDQLLERSRLIRQKKRAAAESPAIP